MVDSVPTSPMRHAPLVGAVAVLAGINLLNNVLAPGLYLLWTSLGVAALAALARVDGLRPAQWGLGRVQRRAAVGAAALAGLTAAAMLLGTRIPSLTSAFIDDRVAGMGADQLAYSALVRAPLGTALFEEVAFRGVLLAMLTLRLRSAWAAAWSSLAFGLWHIPPALGVAAGNEAVSAALGASPLLAAIAAAAVTTMAGVFLCLLRLRYDHLIVPLAVHATANSLAYLLAWLVMGG